MEKSVSEDVPKLMSCVRTCGAPCEVTENSVATRVASDALAGAPCGGSVGKISSLRKFTPVVGRSNRQNYFPDRPDNDACAGASYSGRWPCPGSALALADDCVNNSRILATAASRSVKLGSIAEHSEIASQASAKGYPN